MLLLKLTQTHGEQPLCLERAERDIFRGCRVRPGQ